MVLHNHQHSRSGVSLSDSFVSCPEHTLVGRWERAWPLCWDAVRDSENMDDTSEDDAREYIKLCKNVK